MSLHRLFDLNETLKINEAYRTVLATTDRSQGVIMTLQPGQEIGMEIHDGDQHIIVWQGRGMAILDDIKYEIYDGTYFIIPEGTQHNIINTSNKLMRLLTVYSPPEHKPNTYQPRKPKHED